jgi:hypothetical protein
MQKTTKQNVVLMSPLPKNMPTNSANGLRRDMRPRPPKEILMRRKKESLLVDFAKMEAGPRGERGLAS